MSAVIGIVFVVYDGLSDTLVFLLFLFSISLNFFGMAALYYRRHAWILAYGVANHVFSVSVLAGVLFVSFKFDDSVFIDIGYTIPLIPIWFLFKQVITGLVFAVGGSWLPPVPVHRLTPKFRMPVEWASLALFVQFFCVYVSCVCMCVVFCVVCCCCCVYVCCVLHCEAE